MQIRELLTPVRITAAAIILAAAVASLGGWFWLMTSPIAAVAEPRSFTIEPGWGGGRIADELHRAGLIRSPLAMVILTNLTRTGDRLQAGTYRLSVELSTQEIVRIIAAGEALSTDRVVTIPEGKNVWEVARILEDAGVIADAAAFARANLSHEGTLYPETYRFAVDATETQVLARMQEQHRQATKDRRSDEIIVASMLEKEAKSPEDMALVAGIIQERMKRGMLLQIDATVAYGWCLRTWRATSGTLCDVTQAPLVTEIKVDGPYNTYMRAGLPEAPISNPGAAALNAAANPVASDYLYYLSTRDGSEIIFSKTLEEHNRNRAKHLGL